MISPNFSRKEFECKCQLNHGKSCGFQSVDIELVGVLEEVRNHFGSPVIITSGNRCVEHNLDVSGAYNSFHTKGIAVDFYVKDEPIANVWAFLNTRYGDKYGMGLYHNRIHLDVREGRARWQQTQS